MKTLGMSAPHDEMVDGQKVLVRLHSDPTWYAGIVIKARKEWVELSDHPSGEGIIADSCSIAEWKPND